MAMDSHGRVLRAPHFVTREEHDVLLEQVVNGWRALMQVKEQETARLQAELQRERQKVDMLIEERLEISITRIFVRQRLHRVVRWLIRVV